MSTQVVSRQYSVVRKEKISAHSFQDLDVWKKGHQLVLGIYKISSLFPKDELYGIISQIRRASVSVPANIAEGFLRRGQNDKAHFYNIAQSSLNETKYYLILVKDLGFISSNEDLWNLSEEIGKMLHALFESVRIPQK